MKIKLVSDFLDYYDHHFAGNYETVDFTFERLSKTEMPKWEQFKIMELAQLDIPSCGALFCTPFLKNTDERVVVYTDPYAHQGEGKVLMDYDKALKQYPNCFASTYIAPAKLKTYPPISYRLLSIGGETFKLKYTGLGGDWQSNHAPEVDIQIIENIRFPYPNIYFADLDSYPIWAIDFVENYMGYFYAVDFNTSPQIKGTGLEDVIAAKEVYDLIEKAITIKKTVLPPTSESEVE